MKAYWRLARLVAGAALLLLAARCDWLFTNDTTPPQVTMVTPQDSTFIAGALTLKATAYDSGGIDTVQFVVDGVPVGTGTPGSGGYELYWNSATLPAGTWHSLYARATDLSGNTGYSDTVRVAVTGARELDVFHGTFKVAAGQHVWLVFNGTAGDSLVGEARVSNTGALSDFFWCDSANFELFRNNQGFIALDRQQNQTDVSVAAMVPASGNYSIVFDNAGTGYRAVWARFVLRRRS
jgi:hypothetical protein